METHAERNEREQKHLKKLNKPKVYKKGLLKPVKDKNWKNHLLEGTDNGQTQD